MRSIPSILLPFVVLGWAAGPLQAQRIQPAGEAWDARLIQAAQKNDVSAVRYLLAHQANVDARDKDGNTALIMAARDYKANLVILLTVRGADVNATNSKNLTALLAVLSGEYWVGHHLKQVNAIVQILLDHGAKVDGMYQGNTALSYAAYWHGGASLVQALLDHGALVDVRGGDYSTPLMRASDPDTVRMLLAHGADVNAHDEEGHTALMYAWKPACVNVLLTHGADVNGRDELGHTALMFTGGIPVCATALLAAGADVNARDKVGASVLMVVINPPRDPNSAFYIRIDGVKLLLKRGADMNAHDDGGNTALSLAIWEAKMFPAETGAAAVVRMLKAAGAKE